VPPTVCNAGVEPESPLADVRRVGRIGARLDAGASVGKDTAFACLGQNVFGRDMVSRRFVVAAAR